MPQVINPVVDPDDVNNKAPRLHAAQHKAGGDDPITPEDIGASPENHTHPATTWNNLEGKPSTFPPETHNHDERYSGIHHNHDDTYAVVNHQHGEKADLVNGKLKTDQLPLIDWGNVQGVPVSFGGNPVGSICQYAGSTAPENWLICNGQAVASATYPELYAVIGTKYGGNATNFNLPNLQGRVPIGVSSGHALATTGGSETHTLTAAQMPSHTHTGPSHTHTGPSHTHTETAHTHSIGSHTHNFYVGKPNDASAGAWNGVGYGDTFGNYVTKQTSGASGNTGSAGGGNTGASGTGNTGASGTGATGSAGSGQAHNNMQPFITLNYIIKVK